MRFEDIKVGKTYSNGDETVLRKVLEIVPGDYRGGSVQLETVKHFEPQYVGEVSGMALINFQYWACKELA